MTLECEPLRRADVRLDPGKLQRFIASCVTQGDCLADVFLGTRIYLERDGRITLEFLPEGGTLSFATFIYGPAPMAREFSGKQKSDAVIYPACL